MIYGRSNADFSPFFDEFCAALTADKLLQTSDFVEKTFGESRLGFWQIKNLSASRKKFEVFLRTFYTSN